MSSSIEICLAPELVPYYAPEGKTVVVADILRATSCMVAGLGTRLDHIVPVAHLEEVPPYRDKGYLTAGERNGVKIPEFDLGNSPYDFMDPAVEGRAVVMTTTNGTKAIHLSQAAEQIVIGAFLNQSAVAAYVASRRAPVLIVCAGWKSRFSLEDAIFAGALAHELSESHGFATDSDDTTALRDLYQAHRHDLLALIRNSSHAKRLGPLLVKDDIAFCMQPNLFGVVPIFRNNRLEKAVESAGSNH